MSSAVELGKKSNNGNQPINDDFVIVVYAENITDSMRSTIYGMIDNLHEAEQVVIALLFFVLVIVVGVLMANTISDISRNLQMYLHIVQSYMRGMSQYNKMMAH